ncbi:hypothetical protein BD309DRAFT_868090, partial [Dichomitus squalens]
MPRNRRTFCVCPPCKQLNPISQWIPKTMALHNEMMARRVASEAYQRGRGRGTVIAPRARGATPRGGQGATILRGGRGAPPARSACVPLKRARTPSPPNTPARHEAQDSLSTPFDEIGPIDIDYPMDG